MSSELKMVLSEKEAHGLWHFLISREPDLNIEQSIILQKLESLLWDRMTINEMAGGECPCMGDSNE